MSKKNIKEAGFSIIELCIVMLIIVVMSSISLFYLSTSKKLYAAEDQAIKLSDILQEARQKSFTQKEVMRVEINSTRRLIRLIEENVQGNAADDTVVKEIPFYGYEHVRFDNPTNIPNNSVPTETSPVTRAAYTISQHPLSSADTVCTLRFMRNGSVTNAGADAAGTGAVPTGIAIFVWKPKGAGSTEATVLKAITVGGGTGSLRMWNYAFNATTPGWQEARIQ
jgi:Tfp pilus assembly protein FimT